MDQKTRPRNLAATRRTVLAGAGTVAIGAALPTVIVRRARATPEEMQAAIAKVIGDAKLTEGRITLDIPPLVENGNTVPCTVSVDSPMTATDYVKAIHIVNERNPQPNVISMYLTPRCGRAAISTRIRLNDTQNVVAIAEMSDGSFWSGSANVIVTIGACLEDVI
jgi:sulfur-oxidizing protein SoxY